MYKSFWFRFICLAAFIFSPLLWRGAGGEALAQNPEANRANIWYFGNGAGLDFSSGSPVAITNGALHSIESCASICDLNGNLLFYTDGDTIWDKNHNVMPNGTGLFGDCIPPGPNNSATQGVIIIPQPKSHNIFYVFTVDCAENLGQKGMNYSIVDLNLNNGFGDVTLKNQFLFAPSTEGMAATMNCARDSIWVVGHEYGTNAFYAYLITENGLNTTAVVSNVGSAVMNYEWQMKFSPNGKKLYYYTEIFDFNITNGILSNNITIAISGYGVSFSPDSKLLYITSSGNLIVQFDVSANNYTDILNSMVVLYNGITNDEYWGMQLANDYKLYIAANDTSKMSVINFPNINGAASIFSPYSVDLGNKICQAALPSFVENYFNSSPEDNCEPSEIILSNVFSPNGDGVNDLFRIEGLQQGDEVAIYNRWGTKVYEFANKNDAWDGRTTAGEKCSSGVYYYYVNRKNSEHKKGFIHLFY